ncbi:MAG: PIN domain-containing protein [Bryobacterales bacterium]
MTVLLDTNILLRLVEPKDPEYALVREAVKTLSARGETLCFASQNLVEFWNVCTRPSAQNGLGLTPAQADERARLIESRFRLLPDNEGVHTEWRRLVLAHSVAGVQVHDARLIAVMVAHGLPQLLTLNDRDFARYTGISVVHPRDLVRAPSDQ